MKTFEGKTEQEALQLAAADLGKKPEEIEYYVISDVKKLFSRKVTIGIYTLADVIEFAVNYLETIGEMLELSIKATATLSDDVIKIDISSDYSPKVIGHNGETLRALNELTRSACFNKFGGHYRILLNCDNYKDEKYQRITRIAKRVASEVRRTGVTAELDPMTSDERRVIHAALADEPYITTESVGVGRNRHVTIKKLLRSLLLLKKGIKRHIMCLFVYI